MTSFFNILGGSSENAKSENAESENSENELNIADSSVSIVETGINWIKQHPIFIMWGIVAIAGLVYLAYFRNTNPDDTAAEEALLGKNTDELMDDLKLDLNLTKNVKGEHLTISSDDEEERDDEEDDESQKSKDNQISDVRIKQLSQDLDDLEEYTQESMDI